MSVWSVVVAGGDGRRFGAPKQFAMLGGRPLLSWAVDAARPVSDGVVLVVPADRVADAQGSHGADVVVAGGSTRAESVRAGLSVVPEDAAIIVVHDGARPLASAALFWAVVDAVRQGAEAAVPGLAVADTLKAVADGVVVSTVPRQGLVAVQTPQAFRADSLRRAHGGAGEASDDAGLLEAAGATVRVVAGDPRNLKVTTPGDLEVAQALAAQ
ncbi:MAG TPA: 2-C-methyl-D-erythritol 4-phosphate cytidylyltransferase [Acidimicrobiales bacterium]|nr:2-C-methyl-D-erythritol 4-phosphate cytidylyltransferase [Acidimicrobiales bacterium]